MALCLSENEAPLNGSFGEYVARLAEGRAALAVEAIKDLPGISRRSCQDLLGKTVIVLAVGGGPLSVRFGEIPADFDC